MAVLSLVGPHYSTDSLTKIRHRAEALDSFEPKLHLNNEKLLVAGFFSFLRFLLSLLVLSHDLQKVGEGCEMGDIST